ncbi:two-component system sensor histidine kinase NtrB [Dongia sp. agr-C8]
MLASESMAGWGAGVFEALITAAADGIIVVDAAGHILVFNPACERLFGYRPDEVAGKDLGVLVPSPYRDAKAGRRLASRETLGRRKDGSTFPIYLSVGQGKSEGADISVCIVHDLTERGAAPLMDVSRLSAMAQMGSSMAHEINQPLAAVMNYVKAAQRTLETCHEPRAAKAGELLGKACEQIVRAGAIIRNRRDFIARSQSARREEQLYKIIEKAVARALTGAGRRNTKVTLTLDRNLPPVLVDKMQIQQVIIHLIRNALEAMESVPEPRLSIECGSPEPGLAEVTVSDSGPGLSEAEIGGLFQPFVTTKERGMGLGLTISRSIITAHGGRLWATRNPEAGVSFHFQLPLVEKKTEE